MTEEKKLAKEVVASFIQTTMVKFERRELLELMIERAIVAGQLNTIQKGIDITKNAFAGIDRPAS